MKKRLLAKAERICSSCVEPMSLSEVILNRIEEEGPIPFRDFMETALYHPKLGYYTSVGDKIGVDGDYCTSPYYTTLFGQMLGKQIEEMQSFLKGETFTVVEYGAGTGILSHQILSYLKKNKEVYDSINYCIIEKSPVMREKEKVFLNGKVSWYDSIVDIPKVSGCVFSNELIDNFAVNVVVMCDQLMEVYVDYQGRFVEVLRPASKEIKDYLEELNVVLPRGFRAEINLQVLEWIRDVASALEKGFVLTVDYGFPLSEMCLSHRSSGTLACYYKHEISEDPYIRIGEQDITAHVNFSALYHWGLKNGLQCCGFTDQASFLRSLGLVEHLRRMEMNATSRISADTESIFLLHTLLKDMGSKFKVLIQQKGLSNPQLSGLKFKQKVL